MNVKYVINNPDFQEIYDMLKAYLGPKFIKLEYPPLTVYLTADLTPTEKTKIRDYYLSHEFITFEKTVV